MESTTQRVMLCSLALLVGQADAAPQVANVDTESVDYQSFFTVSNTDIGDTLQGATTDFSGPSLSGCDACVIDGLLGTAGRLSETLIPNAGAVLEIFLDTSVNTSGYDITELVNTTGWNGSSRTNHQYVLALRQVGGGYTDLINVQFPLPPDDPDMTPFDVENPGVQLTINDDGGGNLGVNIDAVRLTFNNDLGGTEGEALQEVDITGVPASPLDPANEFQWSLPGLGDWNSNGSWSAIGGVGTLPNDVEHTAVFGDAIQASSTVTADVPITVNRIQFDSATNTYALAGLGGITLAPTGAGGNPSISALGTHEFQTKVDIQANTVADVAADSTLSFNNRLNLNGNDLILTGSGTANINNVLTAAGGTVNLNAGTLGGGGEVSGSVDNSGGTVAPGNSPGILTIDGNYTQGANATLQIEIDGTTPGEEYDRLVVTGAANLDGTLEVLLGFTPASNDSFDMLDSASVSGDFATFTMDPLFTWNVNDGTLCYDCGAVVFTDYDNDGTWNLGDLNLVLFNWQVDGGALDPQDWINNRPPGGTPVGLPALNQVLFNWQTAATSVATVPEPATMAMFAVGAVLIFGGTRTRRNRVASANRTQQTAGILFSLAILVVLTGRAEAAPQVGNILDEMDDYETVFEPLISDADLAEAINGGTASYIGTGFGTCALCMIDGLLGAPGATSNALLPDQDGVLQVFLDTSVNTLGYDINSLVVTTGWNSASRADHQYTVALRQVGGDYNDIITVDHDNTPHGVNEGTMITINDDGGGSLGTGIDAIEFTFVGPPPTGELLNGNDAYQEIDVFGSAVPIGPPATEFTWNLPGLGDWNDQNSWTPVGGPGTLPNSNEHTAVFGDAIQAPSTVTADVPITLNRIQFDNATNTYALAGVGGITLAATGTGGNPSISALGAHEIQTQVDLQANTTTDVAADSTLSFENALNLNGNELALNGAGTTNVNSILNAGGGTVNVSAGTLGGGGEVGGNVDNSSGTVAPGNSPGILTVDGSYTQGANATLQIEIDGTTPGEQYDRLVVTGAANLDGTLEVLLGFTPASNDSFDVLDFSSVSGDFATFTMDPLFTWNVNDGTLCYNCGTPSLTDYDNDGTWGLGDLNLVLFNWNEDGATLPAAWLNSRPGAGTLVGLPELNQVLFNWGQPGSVAAVPEPASLVMLLIGVLMCCGRRSGSKQPLGS
jgi:hypothetical protein